MSRRVALLRAVAVGGTGKLAMANLRVPGAEAGTARTLDTVVRLAAMARGLTP